MAQQKMPPGTRGGARWQDGPQEDPVRLVPGLYEDPAAPRREAGRFDGGRGPAAWQEYRGLRRRARYDSMAWWALKCVQGVLLGGVILGAGLALIVVVALLEGERGLTWLGIVLLVVGFIVLLRYCMAPATCKWIVTVPENWYFVVEDADGYTLEYLPPGRLIVPWRWKSRVRDYLDFNSIVVNEVIEDVLDSQALPVDIEVSVALTFNPVEADSGAYATLRKFRTQEQFQKLIARDLQDIVRKHLHTLAPQQGMLHNVKSLEGVIVEQLAARSSLGLFPEATRPVMVYVRAPQKVKEAYQSLWARSARVREESQTLLDIKELARDLGVPYEDAFQLFYVMQRGAAPARPVLRGARSPEASLPPLTVFQPPVPDTPTIPAITDTSEHPAAEPDQADAEPPDVPRLIVDPQRAPDPFDVRRRRRDERRSRRAD